MTSQVVSDGALRREEASGPAAFVPVCARVSAHATARPDRPAVVDATGRLTYAELDLRSARLAGRLAESGVGPGSCVAVLLDRSIEFVVAVQAILRAGAAYLPLDVAAPAERLAFVLADSGAAAVVTRGGSVVGGRVPAGPWHTVDVAARGAVVADVEPGPDDLAYVIYTSGSTGRPKGVELTHANLANLVDWHVDAFGITADDRASQVASVGFDAAVWEIWPHLAAGATVHVADEETRRSAPLLRDWLVAAQITVAFAPTAMAEQLVALPWPAETALRTLLTGADVLHRRPPAGLPFALVNNYGPTECTVVATSGPVAAEPADAVPSIGHPIADTVALVLDDALRPVPDGEPGELCLAGALVGRGYRHDPELTAERFVTLLDGGRALRLYRTGDRVRRLPSGELAFLGRLDRQIKLRGYRIEPSEIVATLDRVSGVATAAVVARGDVDTELVAYVVPAEGATVTAGELRDALAARLPDYMIPARFVAVAALPVTVNGKLDEAALPAPTAANLLPGQDGTPPSDRPAAAADDTVEARITEMVCALLKLPSIDRRENIFLAGGHSMLAMQLVARIKQVLGVRLTLRQLFEQPTVEGITATVVARTASTSGARS
jgi:amino acid adenylation domain-containing protein